MGVAGRGATRPGVACDRLGEAGKVIQIPEVIGLEEGYPVPARPFDSQISRGVTAWARDKAVKPHDRRMVEPPEDLAHATGRGLVDTEHLLRGALLRVRPRQIGS